jgi:hypothetical protein
MEKGSLENRNKEETMSDWIPASDEEFDGFYKTYCQKVTAKTSGATPVWTHIPAARVTELNAGYADWYTAWSKLKTPHTHADVLAKDEAREAGKTTLRDFNNQYILYAREVTNAERADLGAHVRGKNPGTVPKPSCQPEADIVYPGKHLLELVKIRRVPGIGNDPPNANFGTRIFWGVMGEPEETDKFRISAPPVKGDDLPHSTFTHRKRYRFDFEGDSGKTVWFGLRYENAKGGKEKGEGPFGPLFSAIIP